MTAGNKLFHHIVENDKVGTRILQEMNKMKLPGEVTFMPINRLFSKEINYPETADAIPMISRLTYDNKHEIVMRFIFGKTLICRSLEVATSLARSSHLDCITLDGDQVSHKGSLTGGYFDSRRSRLELHKTHTSLVTEIQEQKEQLDGHHQKLNNFDCGKEFYTAVEMTAGNKLFHHIVENDKVGTRILQEMNKMKLPGEVTFMPINRLFSKEINYPETADAIPMISRLTYDNKHEIVMRFIFGKTLICRSLEVATSLARSSHLDCITLDGDQVSHKGSLTGGYFDSRRSRLELHKTHTSLVTEIQEQKEQLDGHHQKLNDVESQINQIVGEMQRAETKNSKNKDTFDKMKTDIRLLKDELATIERSRQPKERSLVSHESSLNSMESLEESLRNELQQDLLTQLSVSDQQEVDRLNDEIRQLTQKNKEAFSRRMHLEAQKNKLENLLNNNLCRRKDELEAALQEISVEDRRQKLESERQELNVISGRIDDVNEQIKTLDESLESMAKKQREFQIDLEKKKSDERDTIERINEDSKDLEKMTSKQSVLSKKSMESLEESLRNELQQDLLTQLSVSDQQEVDRLNDEIRQLTQKNKEAFSRRMHLEAQKNKLENLLNNNLCRRKDELEAALQEISVEDRRQKLESERQELNVISGRIDDVNEQIKTLDESLESMAKKQREFQIDLEKKKSDERDTIERINEDSKDLEKMTSKQSVLSKKVEECMRKIRELGTLPGDAETKYANLSLKQLYKKLQQCNQELQKYSHVNKKALDQYLDFSEKKEKLLQRKADLDAGHRSIVDLMTALEQRKYEAIQVTFRQVSMFFGEVFKRLVPSGRAHLDMKTEDVANHESQSQNNSGPPTFDNFSGVSIRVSFTGINAEMKDMQQLSGGQKSLVALAFIFAIQKCDPAPFYLFDEIDQALDPQHRKAVADMIHELCKDAQFITTTFRPELLETADKFYGVKFRNRISHIEVVSKDEAQDFVEDDTQHILSLIKQILKPIPI
ncbi:unnamed protein product, partial [Medioppia subpectinata]